MTNTGTATQTTALFARTLSATTRHIIKPENDSKTLCGGNVKLPEIYVNDSGETVTTPAWMIRELPQCDRCGKSAAERGIVFA